MLRLRDESDRNGNALIRLVVKFLSSIQYLIWLSTAVLNIMAVYYWCALSTSPPSAAASTISAPACARRARTRTRRECPGDALAHSFAHLLQLRGPRQVSVAARHERVARRQHRAVLHRPLRDPGNTRQHTPTPAAAMP